MKSASGEVWWIRPSQSNSQRLKHIIKKHGTEIKQLGFEVEDFIPIVVQFGQFKTAKEPTKFVLESYMFRVVILNQWDGKHKRFFLTTFDLRKKRKP